MTAVADAAGTDRAGFAAGTINRKEFDVNLSAMFGVGNSVVSDKVTLSIGAAFTRA